MSSPLPNYLRTHRTRLGLSQEEAAFLLGVPGMNKGNKVCRDERFTRIPSLETALAYEVIYQKPASELFAGLYRQIQKDVATRAKILNLRKDRKLNHQTVRKREMLASLAAPQSKLTSNPSQS